VTGKALTGYASASGTISSTDTILTAINKLNGNNALKAPLASPNFTGTVTGSFSGSLSGNANTATTLQNNRTISLVSDLSGSASFDGSANIAIITTIQNGAVTDSKIANDAVTNSKIKNDAVTANKILNSNVTADKIADNAVTLGTKTSGNYIATITGTDKQVIVTGSGSATSAVTLALPQDIDTSSNPSFNGATISDKLIITNESAELNGIQFPDGTQQFTAAEYSQLPRAWVHFDSTKDTSGASSSANTNRFIRTAYNVSSVTKLASGKYQLNLVNNLNNTNCVVTGTSVQSFDNLTSDFTIGFPVAYSIETTNIKIAVSDMAYTAKGGANYASNNVVVYSLQESNDSIGSPILQFKLTQSSGDVWNLYGKVNSGSSNSLKYRFTDSYGWSSTFLPGNTSSYTNILYRNNSGKNNISLLTLNVFDISGALVKRFDIQRNFNTSANVNNNTDNFFTITTLTGTSIPDAIYNQVSNTHSSNLSTVEFTLSIS
jgi:hypothetical protein